ncbi:MAG TPA: hypothetical protein VFO19_11280 [Vicinamibacterales bacterium]|nr:hypothetical protein [Vicinamibacterales bacterium]
MAARDDDIDRLYQLRLEEFTPARNELAKRLGKDGGEVRKLAKPNAAAWAVNQLHWQRRAAYDRLMKAAEALRRAHGDRLSGGKADVNAAESAHRDALKAAVGEIRQILEAGGETASPATMNGVNDTLHALPGPDAPGRLVRPLKPRGLEALAGLMPRAGFPRPAEPSPRPDKEAGATRKIDKAAEKRDAAVARREAAEARREAERLEARRREARAAEKGAAAKLAKARATLTKTQKERDALQDRVRFLIKQIDDQVDEVAKLERELADATDAREQLG